MGQKYSQTKLKYQSF